MKKVMLAVAVLIIGMMVIEADAQNITRWYRLSGSTQVYLGSPRTGLPSTGRWVVEVDQMGNYVDDRLVFFWTEPAVALSPAGKKMSDPVFLTTTDALNWWGPLGNLWYAQVVVDRAVANPNNVVGPWTINANLQANWQFIGAASGIPLMATTMRGIVISAVQNNLPVGDPLGITGFGYGPCTAVPYKTVRDTTAIGAIDAIMIELANQGYLMEVIYPLN